MTNFSQFSDWQARLEKRAIAGLKRERANVQSPSQSQLVIADKSLINFASNDYLGLANSQAAKQAIKETVNQFGFGSGGSHLICGHQQPHQQLELALAEFVERDAALTFSSGYMANLALLQTLAGKGDLIFADKLNHASLIDGVRLSGADSLRYPHCDLDVLAKRLKKSGQNKFVVTDSVFSMDGDIAPLKAIAELCEKNDALLIVDDAHGFGVLGKHGRGCGEYFSLGQKRLPVLMSTLGKALGGYGAFVSGDKLLIDYLMQFARGYIYTTAMPAVNAAANLANLNQLQTSPNRVKKLEANIEYFKKECLRFKIKLLPSDTPIQPIIIGDLDTLKNINQQLLAAGFLVGAIRPPTVAANSARLRITLSAAHEPAQIDQLIVALKKALNRENSI